MQKYKNTKIQKCKNAKMQKYKNPKHYLKSTVASKILLPPSPTEAKLIDSSSSAGFVAIDWMKFNKICAFGKTTTTISVQQCI